MIRQCLSIFLLVFAIENCSAYGIYFQGTEKKNVEDLFISLDELKDWQITKSTNEIIGFWKPELKTYDHFESGINELLPITYHWQVLSEFEDSTSIIFSTLLKSTGTFWLGIYSKDDAVQFDQPLLTSNSILKLFQGKILHIRVRRDDTYTGILEEMLGTPFILPPLKLEDGTHQTDMGIGSDCAELAIYGARRMGLKVPYCGPRGIDQYLTPIPKDSLFNGCVIHYGDQVSVLYEDRGVMGKLDAEDLIIQSWKTGTYIVTWKESDYFGRAFKSFRWPL